MRIRYTFKSTFISLTYQNNNLYIDDALVILYVTRIKYVTGYKTREKSDSFVLGNINFILGNTNFILGNSNFILGNTNFILSNTNFILGNTNFILGNTNFNRVTPNINFGNTNFNLGNANFIPIGLIFIVICCIISRMFLTK